MQDLHQAHKLEAIGHLADGVAHDFNNVLAVVLGNPEELGTEPEPRSRDSKLLRDIRDAATHGSALTQQLLAFSRKQAISPRVVDLHGVVRNLARMLTRLVGDKVELLVRDRAERSWVGADESQLQHVLINLITNARDAMPGGGRVVVEPEFVQHGGASSTIPCELPPGGYVVLSVSDNGEGVNAATIPPVFEPFYTSKTAGKGTGLGLATVYGIVRQSGGAITVSAEPGVGSVFTIYLPAATGPASLPAPALVTEDLRGCETILLVEDEPKIRMLMRRALRTYGYTVLDAADADAALRIASQLPRAIHLVITDLGLPDMDGSEMSRLAAAACQSKPVPAEVPCPSEVPVVRLEVAIVADTCAVVVRVGASILARLKMVGLPAAGFTLFRSLLQQQLFTAQSAPAILLPPSIQNRLLRERHSSSKVGFVRLGHRAQCQCGRAILLLPG